MGVPGMPSSAAAGSIHFIPLEGAAIIIAAVLELM